ncbi:MAG: Unknown protein [uncultured Sulfurovum sp.]|uniref:histidine kinase n=1 Tax=uncultured Sulfurovum sp. TaxID=269237 RepID=A0A6S6TEK1_9BACT|nr:MAG: Unknown protein [uncultured Sulfurovum sp.]
MVLLIAEKEYLFRLQVFQQTISTLSMYPLRLYKNSCYETFINDDGFQSTLKNIHNQFIKEKAFDSSRVLKFLKEKMKKKPREIEKEIFVELGLFGDKLNKSMWATKPSNSLAFTRDIKENKKLWFSLMFYDIFSVDEIEKFEQPFERECLVGMYNVYVKINKEYTLSIGRFLTKEQDSDKVVSSIFKNYDFDNINIFELTKVSRRRKIFNQKMIKDEAFKLQKIFRIFLDIIENLPDEIAKNEIEKVAIFIYMIVQDDIKEKTIETLKYQLIYNNTQFIIKANTINRHKKDADFGKYFRKFENYRDLFLAEYTSRIKTSFNKKYSGVRHEDNGFNPINDLIGRICSRLNADIGCYIKYSLHNEKLKLITSYGDKKYGEGIQNLIERINLEEKGIIEKSRVLKIINNYYNVDYQNDINKLILQDIEDNDGFFLPIVNKYIRSNIAIPVTFRYKLLGVLLIDSFRKDSFTRDDINLTLSITSALSVQIFDQIIEQNLFNIIKSVPNQAVLKDEKLLREHFSDLTRYVNRIFFSYGVAIWKYDEKDSSFILKSTTLPIEADYVKITQGSNDLILDLLNYKNNELRPLSEYNIGTSNRFTCCNPKKYDERINTVKIYPIVEDGILLGAFSIYNKREADYKAIDSQSLVSVSAHLKVFFNIVSTFREQRALIANNALHEISKKLVMVQNKTAQLEELLYKNFRYLDGYTRHRFNVKLDDINNFISDVKQSFDFIANQSDAYMGQDFVDEEIEKKYLPAQKQVHRKTLCVRDMINQLINSIPAPLCNKRINIKNNTNKVDVYIAHNVLNDIFQNLLFNAMKYSFQRTEIIILSKLKGNALYISFKNEGLDITLDERDDIFKYGYRCLNAKKFKETIDNEEVSYKDGEEQNAGIGLYKVQSLLKNVLSGEVRLKKESSNFKNGAKIIFEVVLPIKLVKKRG